MGAMVRIFAGEKRWNILYEMNKPVVGKKIRSKRQAAVI